MPDTIEKLGRSVIQHGKDSDRVYLMKLHEDDAPSVVGRIEELAERHDYGKIFCKVPAPFAAPFLEAGFVEEAKVPCFFGGAVDAAFLSRFRKPQRAELDDQTPRRPGAGLAGRPLCEPPERPAWTFATQRPTTSNRFGRSPVPR